MPLNYSIAITLGCVTCLSSFMLGLGQAGFMLPVLMFVAAVASFYLTDYRRLIRLGDWTVNVLVLAIVFLAFGEMLKNRGEDLAFSIARVLVFVEMVLLFREKESRFCWQILMISLLQVMVATVFQQSLFFGFLLLLYIFSGLCAFVLIFLRQENRYFRSHSFVGTFFDAIKAEIAERQDRGKLIRIALVTLMTGPLSIVFSFAKTGEKHNPWARMSEESMTSKEILRSLFAVFPNDQDILARNRWETVDHEPRDKATDAVSDTVDDVIAQKEFSAIPQTNSLRLFTNTQKEKHEQTRFPLLSDRPSFSAGTLVSARLEGSQGELLRHLVRGTFFALLVAVTLFCFVPRIGRIDFENRTFRFGEDYWAIAVTPPVSTVGFREEIRLGSLGTVLPHRREVMSVRFAKCADNKMPGPDEQDVEIPYSEIQNEALYFRGVALDTYADGTWKIQPTTDRYDNKGQSPDEWNDDVWERQQAALHGTFHVLRPGAALKPSESEKLLFENDADLVALHMIVKPLDTTVFFAPWPFFLANNFRAFPLSVQNGRIQEMQYRRRDRHITIYSPAFKHGTQLPLIPCQERVTPENLLQIPERGLDALKKLARQWDDESKLPREDIMGRAKFMEQKFLTSYQFQYKLGGTVRGFNLDPLEDFIGHNPTGHCEYFAGALALMLRSVGIHSRVIVGFKTYATSEPSHQVRQSDAHAWVEAFLPPEIAQARDGNRHPHWWVCGGWLRLDPSPASEATFIETVSFNLTDLGQWIQTGWKEFVLNMNSSKQMEWIYTPTRQAIHFLVYRVLNFEFWKGSALYVVAYYRSLFAKSGTTRWGMVDWVMFFVPVVLFLLLTGMAIWLLRRFWPGLARYTKRERRRRATIEFYARMEKLLAQIGPLRRVSETPHEYVRKLMHSDLTLPVVNLYYRVRFGGTELSDEQIASVRESLDSLEKIIGTQTLSPMPDHSVHQTTP